jgi:hypothetical protein
MSMPPQITNTVTLNLFQGPSLGFALRHQGQRGIVGLLAKRSDMAARWMLKQVQHDGVMFGEEAL